MRCTACCRLVIAIAVAAFGASLYARQEQPAGAAREERDQRQPEPARNPSSLYGRDTTQGVYVRDSAVAVEKFALAERMEHLREWDKSADVYMEILQGYADRVVPSQVDKDNKIYQYTSVGSAVQERLAKWPEDGLAVYKRRYETEASALFDGAGDDLAKLHKVYSTYFVTDAATRAGLRLMDLYLENADFPAAAWIGDRLSALHPGLGAQRPLVLYRTAIAYQLSGNDASAKSVLAELKRSAPTALGHVRGADVILAESLERELSATRTIARDLSPDSWPIAFGSPDRARIAAPSGLGGAKLFSIALKQSARLTPGALRRDLDRQSLAARGTGVMTGIMPVVDSGELFFQDNARVYAVSLESGTALPGWADTYDGDQDGQFAMKAWSTPHGQQCTITVTESSVYAVMGLPDPIAMQMTNTYTPPGETRLVCLDRRTGKEKWSASPKRLTDSRNLDFVGSPLVIGDALYIQGRGGKGMQFDDAYVICLDAATGKPRWTSYLASASNGVWDFDSSASSGGGAAHIAYAGGRLYAQSNLGAVASIDAYDGTIVWLNIYPRDIPEPNRMLGGINPRPRNLNGGAAKPWTFNPTIVSNGNVFALPSDGSHVLVYDASTGVERKRIPVRMFDNADTLLGVVDDKLILASQNALFCVNWKSFDADRGQRENVFWLNGPFKKPGFPDESIRGRGLVTADAVYVPTAWGVHRIALKSGKIVETYPAGGEWDEDEGPGNVLVTPDRLILAGPQRVTVYTDLKMAMAKLDAAVAAAPDQPEPRLRYAEIMSAAGKWDIAIAKLDEAIQVLGGPGAMPPSAARDRVFADALSFALRVARDAPAETNAAMADALFDRAAASAGTPSQNVNYRLSRARFARARANPEMELRLYQQIVADPSMREISVSAGETGGTRSAAVVAESAIDDLLRRAGRGIYEPLETAAGEKLEAAKTNEDPATALVAVAREFPNSKAAPRALQAAAEAYEAAIQPRLAAQVLRENLFKYPENPERAKMIEALARNYLALPNRADVALARLAQGAKLPGNPRLTKPLKLPDGTTIENVTFAQAAESLRAYTQRNQTKSLPDMKLPSSDRVSPFAAPTPDSVVDGVASLPPSLRDFARFDRLVAYTADNKLAVFDIGKQAPLFASNALEAAPPVGVAWTGNTLLAWNGDEIVLLQDDGKPAWQVSVGSMPTVDVIESPDSDSQPTEDESAQAEDADDGITVINGVRLRAQVNVRNGEALIVQNGRLRQLRGGVAFAEAQRAQQQEQQADAAGGVAPAARASEQIAQVRPLTDRVILTTTTGRVVALDLSDGKILWQTRVADRSPSHLLASDDFVVLRTDDGARVQLIVLDALGGQPLRRQNFANENGAGIVPINLALAPDGTLVYIMPDRIRGKDLFEPTDKLTWEVLNSRNDPGLVFVGATGPEHLQIADGRIIVLSSNGAYVRVHSLETGKVLQLKDAEALFRTGANNWQAIVRVVGSKIYTIGSRELFSYDVDQPEFAWRNNLSQRTVMRARDLFVTPSHVVAILEMTGPGGAARPRNAAPTSISLEAVSRAPLGNGRESGRKDHSKAISDPAGIVALQPVDGGLYYLAKDQKLHFLQGAGETTK